MAALLLIGGPGLPGVLLLLLYRAFFRTRIPLSLLETPAAAPAAAALALIALALQVPQVLVPQARAMADRWALTSTWERAGEWLAAHTPPDAVILPPVRGERLPPGADPRSLGLDFDVSGLVATAGRSLWTNYKFGAAPMWAPSTYRVWRGRYDAALKLDTAADRIAYARQHGIAYVATFCDPAVPAEPAYRDGDLCLYAAGGKG